MDKYLFRYDLINIESRIIMSGKIDLVSFQVPNANNLASESCKFTQSEFTPMLICTEILWNFVHKYGKRVNLPQGSEITRKIYQP